MTLVLLFSTLGLILGMGNNKAVTHGPMGLEALFAFCGLPLECSEVPAWEGQTVQIEGWVDPVNIFDRRTFPQLPYEKFVFDSQNQLLWR